MLNSHQGVEHGDRYQTHQGHEQIHQESMDTEQGQLFGAPAPNDLTISTNPLTSGSGLLGGTVGRYILKSNDPIFLGAIKNFPTWMAEVDRVVSYHLFESVDAKPNISFLQVETQEFNGVAYTHDYQGGKRIVISSGYLRKIPSANRWKEITGVVAHELTHALQNNGNGSMPGYLIEAIADYIRMRSGVASPNWRPDYTNMDASYSGGAFFLDFIDRRHPGFVKKLNEQSKSSYSVATYRSITGTTKKTLWEEYVKTRGV